MFGGHRNDVTGLELRIERLERLLRRVLHRLNVNLAEEHMISAQTQQALDDLTQKVHDQTTVEQSVETALTGLSGEIRKLKDEANAAGGEKPQDVIDAIEAAAALVDANTAKLQAAVAANTAPAPAVVGDPTAQG